MNIKLNFYFYLRFIKNVIYIFLFLISFNGVAQNFSEEEQHQIDSLNTVITNPNSHDTSLTDAYLGLVEVFSISSFDTVIPLSINAKLIAEKALQNNPNPKVKEKLLKSLAYALNNIGYVYQQKGEAQKALEVYNRGLKIQEEIGNKLGIASLLNNIGIVYYHQGDFPKTLKYWDRSLKLREEIGDKGEIANSLNNIGNIYNVQGNISKALECWNKSIQLREEAGDELGVANSLLNLGVIYEKQGDISKALNSLHKSLKISEKLQDKRGIASVFSSLGFIYYNQDDVDNSIKYYKKSLEISKELGNKKAIAKAYKKLGSIHGSKGDSVKALKYVSESLKICEEINYKTGIISATSGLGGIYKKNGDYSKALDYYRKSLKISKELGYKGSIAKALENIGEIYVAQNNLKEAHRYFVKSLSIAQELGFPKGIETVTKELSVVYERQGKWMLALEIFKLHIQMRDSINNEATQKASAQQQAKYEYEKQKAIDDSEHDKLLAIEQEEKEKQQILTGATAGGLGLVVVFLIFVFNRLRVTKKQKLVIEEQKHEVEQQKEVVEEAHHELEEKNQEIMDSITYAKRIQSAILPPAKVVKEYLQESFILYKPKDIVAGDFYWMEHKNGKVLFAAADCTGHGVPGAMVSVVCNNALNRSVREHGLTDAGAILDKTREIVIQEFEKSDEEVKDGMDIALCSLEGNKLQYAGAHNPLWIIRNGELMETKANKQPIGQFDNPEPYTTHSFELEKGDSIYIFSDGYVDQFGGEKGKKFKAKAFRELLLSIQEKAMEDQKTIIDDAFETWRGSLEQIDDVCVIGVRV